MDWKPFLGMPLWFWLFVLPTLLVVACFLLRRVTRWLLPPIWKLLNFIYDASGVIAAFFMVSILVIIIAQMVFRWTGHILSGATDFAGYAMAATSFFALAHALNRGAHIRVSILLNLNRHTKLWFNVVAMYIAAVTATYFARFAIKTNQFSEMLNDRTQGLDKVPEQVLTVFKMLGSSPAKWGEMWASSGTEWVYTPIWLPQLAMSFGTVLLAIALWDNLIRLVVTGESFIEGEKVK